MTGVPTKLLTVNCSVRMSVYNPATFFGIHVSSSPISLMYSEIAVAKGQVRERRLTCSQLLFLDQSKLPI